jgi:hypothetical protein
MNAAIAAGAVAGAFVLGFPVAADIMRGTHGAPTCAEPVAPTRGVVADHDSAGRLRLDPSKPVPAKAEIIRAWRQRQDAIKSFRFAWVEDQCHARGWIPNPRYPEREWLAIPGLLSDRSYSVTKALSVDGTMMRYSFELDRKEEPDGVDVVAPQGDNQGLGVRRHYSYLSVFDGQRGETRVSSLTGSPPAAIRRVEAPADAQNLDTRAILLAFRPLDSTMGHLLLDRAVTNERRSFYRGRSVFLLEERHDPSGWKTMLWVEPERDFLVSRCAVYFEQKWIVDIDIDYQQDARWGWIPSRWRVTEMLADGSRRLVTEATVSRYSINQPINIQEFK